MVDRDAIEKSLLLNVVKQKQWNELILNDITEEYFTPSNKPLFEKIKLSVQNDEYPTLQILAYEFGIADEDMSLYLQIENIKELCDVLRKEYIKENVKFEVKQLNQYQQELETDPASYVTRLGNTYSSLKSLSFTNRTIGMFDQIEDILNIDPTDVISTGFKELDQELIGWRRGEELAVFVARPGQGKSWFGLKFALNAALRGEKVGLYSGEMSLRELQERVLCCAKQEYTWSKQQSLEFIKKEDPQIKVLTQKELRRRANINDIEEMVVKDKLTYLVIDQLSLMQDITAKPGTPIRQQFGNITMDLFSLSTRYSIPITLLAQSNRTGAQSSNGPLLEDIAESDTVGQNATRVISMKNSNGLLTLNITKNRYGKSGGVIKYEVDFGINKYRPVVDPILEAAKNRKNQLVLSGTINPPVW